MADKQPVRVKASGFNLTGKDFEEIYAKQGEGAINSYLTDGKHEIVHCSNCGKHLVDVWITQPDFEMTSEIVAECPYCGDKSFPKKVEGSFHLGHTDDTTIDHMENKLDLDDEGKLLQKVFLKVKKG